MPLIKKDETTNGKWVLVNGDDEFAYDTHAEAQKRMNEILMERMWTLEKR